MQIELKTTKLTKSKIQQMDYAGVPTNPNIEVLGWVNMDKKRYVIIKSTNSFYRAEFITKIEKKVQGVQFSDPKGGWEFPEVNVISCETTNRGRVNYSAKRDDKENIELYNTLLDFKKKTEVAGQIYY